MPSNTLDGETIAELRALSHGEGDFLAQLIGVFLNDLSQRMSAIDQALAQRDNAALTRAAHKLRGSSASIGAARVSALCGELEQAGLSGSFQELEAMVGTLHQEAVQARRALERELANDG